MVEVSGQKVSFSWEKLLENKRHFWSLFHKSVFLSKKDSVKRHFSHDSVLPSPGADRWDIDSYWAKEK